MAPEWPLVRSMLPDMANRRILDLGCGFGAFDRWAIEAGADSVWAIDLSEKMLARARALTSSDRIRYVRGDLTDLDGVPNDFDLVYSALAFHYVPDIRKLFRDIRAHLADAGCLVMTLEHPIYTAPSHPEWITHPEGNPAWLLDGYFREGERTTNWITEGVVKYHRTMSTYLDCLLTSGFTVTRVCEWAPSTQDLQTHPEWANEIHRPMFLILRADAA